jgi:2-oxoglutarate ferredoxin oxidoreductase subunit beta
MMEIQLKPVDYKSDVEPTWCSGCGDFGVVAALTRAYAGRCQLLASIDWTG